MPRLDLVADAVRALVGVNLASGNTVTEENPGVGLRNDDARARGPQGDGGVLCVVGVDFGVCVSYHIRMSVEVSIHT